MHKPVLPLVALLSLLVSHSRADIIINEVVHAASERVLKWDANGVPTLGTGKTWYASDFDDSAAKGWQTGPGPFGFGTVTPAGPTLGTNLQTQMQYLTPTVYLRKTINVSGGQAGSTDPLEFAVDYNDGFILYLNGVEVARRWAGPANQYHYFDQPAYDPDLNNTTADANKITEIINLGAANTRLVSGNNVIAVQALNISNLSNNFLFSASLRIGGATQQTLVATTDTWNYFPGVVEPSGGLYDPALLNAGKLSVPWGKTAYGDSGWTQGTGPIGQGASPLGTTIGGVVGVTPSLYTRIVFPASLAQASDTAALQLSIDYDDGFVAYINGVEVARSTNLQNPNTFVPRTAVANAARNFGTTSIITLDSANRLLVSGNNVLAIQVHNLTVGDSDIAVKADLRTGAGGTLVANNASQWKYLVGTQEPVLDLDGAIEDNPDLPDSVVDWIELHNNGAAGVSLNGWTLTDSGNDTTQWAFPNVTIPAGGYLVVMCDGKNITVPGPNGYLHTNFKIDSDGEFLGLYNATGTLVHQIPSLPPGRPHYSYGRNGAGQYVYSDLATPGAANAGTEFSGIVAAPTFNVAGGYYASSQVITLSCSTVGASIRYTTNGSDPTETTGTLYSASFPITATTAIRARAFLNGSIPSATTTQNYLINEGTRANLPSITFTADEARSLYRPYGVMAIKEAVIGAGANFATEGTPWTGLNDPAQYNNPNLRGRYVERPVTWQMIFQGNAPGFTIDFGLRMAGSPFTRPRYTLPEQNRTSGPNVGQWSATNALRKPSMNLYMRDDLGGDPLNFPVIANSPVTKHSDFRFRAGHNDLNPFIVDELARRLYAGTGQPGSLGINANLYINGVYKGIYNLCQHVRQEWCREAFGSDLDWDVIQVGVPSDGDLLGLQETITFLRNNNQAVLSNYQAAQTRINVENAIDYWLVNIYGATGDWPQNNWICGRERSTNGRFHFFVWDAEGAFGSFGLHVRSNNFSATPGTNGDQSSLVSGNRMTDGLNVTPRLFYLLLRDSPEFKLQFADRIQKHFFNGGALTDAAITAKNTALVNEASPFISGFNSTRIPNWINGVGDKTRYNGSTNIPSRRQVLLSGYTDDTAGGVFVPAHFVSEGLWPSTLAPSFSQHGGPIGAGINLTITNPNAGGTIYYTTNGVDPRMAGGGVAGTAYSGPVPVNQTTTVRARVLNNSVWSPLLEATFSGGATPSLLITEIMYHPPDNGAIDGNEYEFIELKNVGATTINLFGMKFTDGIEYSFPPGASIAPAGFVVLAKNATLFSQKYPGTPVLGAYGPASSLNNAGETVTLRDGANNIVFSVTYDDKAPWPAAPDGTGPSLVPNLPNSNPDPNDAGNWRISGNANGSPGADDPAPGIPKVQITEVLANSTPPAMDAIELFNTDAAPADISGWFLSDDISVPKKYRIPDGTIIPAGGYLVIYESSFNTGPNAFALSQNGDEAMLSSADAAGTLTGYTEFLNFGASEPDVTYGRYTNTETPAAAARKFIVAQKQNTLGAANAGPRVGPVIISELYYQPSGTASEFIEIRNNSNVPIPLFDPANPANTWRIDGVGFSFPPGVTIQPRQFILISAISPTTFRASYGIPAAVPIYGPYSPANDLANTGERVSLQKPGTPYLDNSNVTVVPYIDLDYVTYSNTWVASTAGGGKSLERGQINMFADDKNVWKVSPNSGSGGNPGRFGPVSMGNWVSQWFGTDQSNPLIAGDLADPEGDSFSNLLEYTFGLLPWMSDSVGMVNSTVAYDGATGPYLMISFRRSLSTQAVTINVDIGSSVTGWGTGAIQVGSAVNNGDGTETVTFRDTQIFDPAIPRFMRVRAVK